MKKFRALMLAVLALLVVVSPKAAMAQGGGGDYRVRARMGTRDASQASAVYRERIVGSTLIQRFNVQVEHFTPGVAVGISINGAPFGTIVPNALGIAELEFRTTVVDDNPHDNEPPLPTDFPRINVGDTITVGSLSGSFVRR